MYNLQSMRLTCLTEDTELTTGTGASHNQDRGCAVNFTSGFPVTWLLSRRILKVVGFEQVM